jgi:protein-disulfide isomerase
MNRKLVFGVSAVALVAVFLVASSLYRSQRAQDLGSIAQDNASTLVRDHSPVLGDATAKVTIVKFTDPACETCAAFSDFLKQWVSAHPGRIKLVIRYAPFHEGASDVVKILEAAKRSGKFWETLELLYASQHEWTHHHVVMVDRVWPILDRAGLDIRAIRAAMDDPEIDRVIQQDLADVRALNVDKTPGFFVNGRPLQPFGAQQLRMLIQSELRANYPEAVR